MEVVQFKACSLWAQRIIECSASEITLAENYIKYYIVFYADEPKDKDDLKGEWEEGVYNNYTIVALKENIAGLEMSYSSKSKCWQVSILVTGFATDISLFVKKASEAKELFDKIFNYLYL